MIGPNWTGREVAGTRVDRAVCSILTSSDISPRRGDPACPRPASDSLELADQVATNGAEHVDDRLHCFARRLTTTAGRGLVATGATGVNGNEEPSR
jgi:hypothetical protein